MDLIHVIVDGLIHSLDSVLHENLAIEKLRIVIACKGLNFLDQRGSLLVGDELGGLNAIHQQLQFRKLEHTTRHIIPVETIALDLNDINAKYAQCLDVIVNALTLSRDAVRLQITDDLVHTNRLLLVGILKQVIHDMEQLQFLERGSSHSMVRLSVITIGI